MPEEPSLSEKVRELAQLADARDVPVSFVPQGTLDLLAQFRPHQVSDFCLCQLMHASHISYIKWRPVVFHKTCLILYYYYIIQKILYLARESYYRPQHPSKPNKIRGYLHVRKRFKWSTMFGNLVSYYDILEDSFLSFWALDTKSGFQNVPDNLRTTNGLIKWNILLWKGVLPWLLNIKITKLGF